MAANTAPVFALTPNVGWGTVITAANTATDGTGTTMLCFTAGANGAFVSSLKAVSLGSCVATMMRFFLNNGSTPATAGNNALIKELGLPATTASNSIVLPEYEVPINKFIPAGYRIYATLGVAVSAGYIPIVFGGDY